MKLSKLRGYGPEPVHYKSEFSDHLAERICAEALDTPSITMIANRVGLRVQNLYRWLEKGRAGHPDYEAFYLKFVQARSTHEGRWLGNVEDVASLDDPRAANARLRANEFLLRNHFRGQYSERAPTSTTTIENQTNFNLEVLSTDQARTLHKMLKAVVTNEDGDHEEAERLLAEVIDVEEEDQQQASE